MMIVNTDEVAKRAKIKYYKCGSVYLANFLIDHKHIPVGTKTAVENGKILWLFIVTDTLSELLTEWSNNEDIRRAYFEQRKKQNTDI